MTLKIDENLESYKGFHDSAWANKIADLVNKTKYQGVVENLIQTWRGASSARRLPFLLIMGLESILKSIIMNIVTPDHYLEMLVEEIKNDVNRLGLNMTFSDKQVLLSVLRSKKKSIEDRIMSVKDEKPFISSKDIWKQYLTESDFILSLWMSEMNAYCSIYFAYESLIVDSLSQLRREDESMHRTKRITSGKEIAKRLTNIFGRTASNEYWEDREVNMARLIRHAIVHNGQKITVELERYRSVIPQIDGRIMITAKETNKLYDVLKNKSYSFVSECIGK